jgi:demethylmenaquinone methyltransferase/2-methoxy-6-polyprenyl-1,4-benzoquinol methylase
MIFRWGAPLFAREARRWNEDDARAFAALLSPALQPDGHLLDLGGGTGALAALLARVVPCKVSVVDRSPQMLRYATGAPDVDPVLGDATALRFVDDTFDAALVCDALHHIREREAAAREMARVVRPGGAIVIAELDASVLRTRLIGLAERVVGEPAGFMRPEELARLMAAAGAPGSTQQQNGASYVFVGKVVRANA